MNRFPENRKNAEKQKIEQFLFLTVIGAIIVAWPTWLSAKPFIIKDFGVNEVTQLLTLLLLISLFLERALEVFISTWRGSTIKKIDVELQKHERKIYEINKWLENQPQTEISTTSVKESIVNHSELSQKSATVIKESPKQEGDLFEQLNLEIDALKSNEMDRANYKSDTRRIALWSSLILGIMTSAVGIRALETFVNIQGLPDSQVTVFRWLDVFLTGGLIAGGSEGIHKLTQVIVEFLEATSQQIKDKTS